MAIDVVQSQRLSVLLQALQLRSAAVRASPMALLQPLHCIVPNLAVEQWLKQALAAKQGVSAHWQFHYGIRSFQWYAYQQVLSEKDRVRKANLPQLMVQWRIYQHFQSFFTLDAQPIALNLSAEHALYSVLKRALDNASRAPKDKQFAKLHSMLYWLAKQSAQLFSHYSIYRGQCRQQCVGRCTCPDNWLVQWGAGQHLSQLTTNDASSTNINSPANSAAAQTSVAQVEVWQAYLWQTLLHEDWLETQHIDTQFWQQLHSATAPALAQLPEQLILFTLSELAPSQLNFLRRMAQSIDVLILHFNPSQEYWADMVDPNWKIQYDLKIKARYVQQHPKASDADIEQFSQKFSLSFNAELRESRHPLLTRFGKQARDQFSLLANLAAGDEGQWVDAFVDDFPDTLLGRIQRDILYLNDIDENSHVLAANDQSLQLHVCHSALRQLEVVKDQLTAWFAADPTRQPRDVVLLCPNLAQLEPYIRSVFQADPKQLGYLPIKIAGVAPHDHMQAWQAIYARMALLQGRFQPQQLVDWLSLSATMQYYQLDSSRIERLMQLLCAAGFRRGFDAEHLQQSLDPEDHDYRFSFVFALNRLALGVVIPEHTVFAEQLSFADVLPSDFELIATAMQIQQDLAFRRHWLEPNATQANLAQHLQRILSEIDGFIAAGVEHLSTAREQAQKLWRMYGLATVNTQSNLAELIHLRLPFSAVLDEVAQNLQQQFEQAASTGFITFAEIGQLRPLPYQLVILLNLDQGSFPSKQRHRPFDLMQLLPPRLGDRTRLDDDQGAFLDALLLAQQELWLFYNGFDVADAEVREPSSVVQELMAHVALLLPHEGDVSLAPQVNLDGLTLPQHLAALYRVHALQPFDAAAFGPAQPRFADAWSAVALQLLQASAPRQAAFANTTAANTTFADSTAASTTFSDTAQSFAIASSNITADSTQPATREASSNNDLQVIDATRWIRGMLFPAQLYLQHWGIRNLSPEAEYAEQEALLLDGLSRYQLRNVLLQSALDQQQNHTQSPAQNATQNLAQQPTASAFASTLFLASVSPAFAHTAAQAVTLPVALLQDQLPVGKMQQGALQRAVEEQQQLLERMQPFAQQPTPTTQQLWHYSTTLAFQIRVPDMQNPAPEVPNAAQTAEQPLYTDWVSIHASSARGQRPAQIWLEYLMWYLWHAAQHPKHSEQSLVPNLRRVAVFNDHTVICCGLDLDTAQQAFEAWLAAWRYAQQQPLVLPAALLMQLFDNDEPTEWEMLEEQPFPKAFDKLLSTWRNTFQYAAIDFRDLEQSRYHRDWQFLLDHQDDSALLQQACQQFAYALYQPLFATLELQ